MWFLAGSLSRTVVHKQEVYGSCNRHGWRVCSAHVRMIERKGNQLRTTVLIFVERDLGYVLRSHYET